jgi:hypothetical protein
MTNQYRPNPFDPARPARATFVGREDVLDQLVLGLQEGRSYEVTGQPRIGKTSLLPQVERRLVAEGTCHGMSPTAVPLYVECPRPHEPKRLFAKTLDALAESMRRHCGWPCPSEILQKAQEAAKQRKLADGLELVLNAAFDGTKHAHRVILLVDAVHRLLDPTDLESLLGALNRLVDRQSVNVLLAGRHSLSTCVLRESVSVLCDLLTAHHELGPLDEAETEALLAVAVTSGYIVESGSGRWAHQLTGGHPYRLQYYFHSTLARHGRVAVDLLKDLHTMHTIALLDRLLVEPHREQAGTSPSIFVSYSHRDEDKKDVLMRHLKALDHAHQASAWCDDSIQAGAPWEEETVHAIEGAKIAILLITADFLSSKFITEKEIPHIFRRSAAGTLKVVPILGRAVYVQDIEWLAPFNIRPKGLDPIWSQEDKVDAKLRDIVAEIARMLSPAGSEPGA